ncbi:VP91/P95 [Operophtera brumata nucleopolyhedrovirus]|uniref:VP91/P95 n=1 Tax=Operophtera brumata nucleopolyhedrovirus TaxID=1046267 RepID=A0A2H4UZS3_9ABAC|nr:VP91/P95 [Operophtera brumata nucleopolyhedrovirus]AUA60304.1 VP91/P95 [Operophtera brumata nucleopolyhedrovirus]
MSIVPVLLIAIVVMVLFTILYLSIHDEFNENEFDARLNVLNEYLKRTEAEHAKPPVLGYVSRVDGHQYDVSHFDTDTLQLKTTTLHDDRTEVFDFINQNLNKKIDTDEFRIAKHISDNTKYMMKGDDGWIEMSCGTNEYFDDELLRCVPMPPCYNLAPGLYGMNERLIDSLVLNHNVDRATTSSAGPYHPTMYLRCLQGGSHIVEECPENHYYDHITSSCQLRNDCINRPDGYVLNQFPDTLAINEYMKCENNTPVVTSCDADHIFDRRLMTCIRAEPCALHGIGYTYITDEIGSNQFWKCASRDSSDLITCVNRVFANDEYQCAGDRECLTFQDGSGTQLKPQDNDIIGYNTGVLICDNYNKQEDIACPSYDIVDTKTFNEIFRLGVSVPSRVFDTTSRECVPFDMSHVTIINPIFPIINNNDYNVQFDTAFVGKTEELQEIINTNRLDGHVEYARDRNVMGINISDNSELECMGDGMYDIFDGTKLNVCHDDTLIETIVFKDGNKYFRPQLFEVAHDDDYNQQCASQMSETSNYIENRSFTKRILTNILRNDVCDTTLHKIHALYTTNVSKYTTLAHKYNYESVELNNLYGADIERYPANIPFSKTTMPYISYNESSPQTDISSTKNKIDFDRSVVLPVFNNFVEYETITPVFNPFSEGGVDVPRPETRPPSPPPPTPSLPDLTLTDKLLTFSCYYSLPTFKLTECDINDQHIKDTIAKLKQNVKIDQLCERAAGLANIINSYAFINGHIACQCILDETEGIVIKQHTNNILIFTDQTNQSSDGQKYNQFIHRWEDNYFSCPDPSWVDMTTGTCNIPDNDKLYYIDDMQNELGSWDV